MANIVGGQAKKKKARFPSVQNITAPQKQSHTYAVRRQIWIVGFMGLKYGIKHKNKMIRLSGFKQLKASEAAATSPLNVSHVVFTLSAC